MKVSKGTSKRTRAQRVGGSISVTLPISFCEYAGINVGDEVIIVCDKSRKYGNFLGVGLPKEKVEE